MATTKTGTITDRIRQFAAVAGMITRKQVREALSLTVAQVDNAFKDLVNQGWLVREAQGLYKFVDINRYSREAPVEDKIWHAMRINPDFTVADIARQAGTTNNYVAKKVRQYADAGWVVLRRRTPNTDGTMRVKVWSLTQKGRDQLTRPVLDVFVPDPLINAVVTLNKLVCTGRAQTNAVDMEKAVKLADEIKSGLNAQSQSGGTNHGN